MVIFAAYQLIPKTHKEGIHLLCCIRSYIILDTYISIEGHTSKTLQDSKAGFQNFANLIKVRITFTVYKLLNLYSMSIFTFRSLLESFHLRRIETFLNYIGISMPLMILRQKELVSTITQNLMKSYMGH